MVTNKQIPYIFIFFILLSFKGFSVSLLQMDTLVLYQVKQKIQDGTASERTLSAYKALISKANKLLSIENPTVMDKTIMPPTGNKHDYLSISRYWWPDPESPNGLPWSRKDGETNPDTQTNAVDRKRLGTLTSGVENLCLAYYFSNDTRYAEKAASMLKTWFLDEETRMNPHLEYAQSVPGNSKGRSSGILDGKSIASVVPDALIIISNSSYWTKNDTENINQWLSEYLTWLTESELGNTENNQKNNHASWYKFQVASLAYYLGNETLAKETVSLAQESLDQQLDFEGKQTHELERTRSFFYSCYNLEALSSIAMVGDKIDMDMWNFKSKNKKSLALAISYITPIIDGKEWPYTDIYGTDLSRLVSTLSRMSKHSKSKTYSKLLSKTIDILLKKEKSTHEKNDILDALCLKGEINI
ncbi:alginate lyase [Mariniflexile fucanivorans]|uniref:Alginate lyase n=1 Tax=Mariniflexile fucanivorans TaxID=264023 RepID=A0A4V2QE76_9FLAO|nr:alginate lyase family protein [Mariniflexile fucanivorans]TCL67007.1 alginate lyase [Mariniflexile fucanivorans]